MELGSLENPFNSGQAAAAMNCDANASELDVSFFSTNDSFDSLIAAKVTNRHLFEDQLHEQKAELLEFRQVESRLLETAGSVANGVKPEKRPGAEDFEVSTQRTASPVQNPGPSPSTLPSCQTGASEYGVSSRSSSSAEDDSEELGGLDADDSADRAVIEYQLRRKRFPSNTAVDEVSTASELTCPVRSETSSSFTSRSPTGQTKGSHLRQGSRRAWAASYVLDESTLSPRTFLRNYAGNEDDAGMSTSIPYAGKEKQAVEQSIAPPPTSKLLAGLFPGLRPRKLCGRTSRDKSMDMSGLQCGEKKSEEILFAKLKDLETKLAKLRLANDRLRQEQARVVVESKRLEAKHEAFDRHIMEERIAFEKYKSEEAVKLRKERSLWEKHRKATEILPSRSERAEIEDLKQRMSEMVDRWKMREGRNSAENARQKRRIDQLINDNAELHNQIKLLEHERLRGWGRAENNATKSEHDLDAAKITHRKSWFPNSKALGEVTKNPSTFSTGVSRLARPLPRSKSGNSIRKHSASLSTSPGVGSFTRATKTPATSKDPKREKTPVPRAGMGVSAERPRSAGKFGQASPWDKSYSSAVAHTSSRSSSPSRAQPLSAAAATADTSARDEDWGMHDDDAAAECCAEMFAWVEREAELDYSMLQTFSERAVPGGSRERVYPGDTRVIIFKNGTAKLIRPDGASTVWFSNGDVKHTIADQHVIYFYANTSITHTSFPDGAEVFEFPNGQTERRRPDGTREIVYADNTVKHVYADGSEESVFPNGMVQRVDAGGKTLVLEFADGVTEVYAEDYIQQLYPGGRCKTIYNDGRQEIRLPDGSVKIKDSKGQIIEEFVDRGKSGVIGRPLDVGS